jgi:hypothetical protein
VAALTRTGPNSAQSADGYAVDLFWNGRAGDVRYTDADGVVWVAMEGTYAPGLILFADQVRGEGDAPRPGPERLNLILDRIALGCDCLNLKTETVP